MSLRCAIVVPRYDGEAFEWQEPLGAEAICGFLRKNGVECRVFDRRLCVNTEEISAYDPTAVGFSVMSEQNVPDALRVLQTLLKPGRRFFAGGLWITQETIRAGALFPAGTLLISGEGENAALAFARSENPFSVPPLTPDDWAFASRDAMGEYISRGGVIQLRSARGCGGHCAFCTHSGEQKHPLQMRSLRLIADEMESLIEAGYPPVFNFTDDEFGDTERIGELCTLLRQRRIRAAFSLELRPQTVLKTAQKDWLALHEGGLCRIFTGLESLNPDTLRCWNKPHNPEALLQAIRVCKSSGILCETGYILFHARSTRQGIMEETARLRREDMFNPKTALSRMILYPGSHLHAERAARGTVFEPLAPNAEVLYLKWKKDLGELFKAWGKLALRLPGAACRDYLASGAAELPLLRAWLDRVNALAYAKITGQEVTAEETELLLRKIQAVTGGIPS